MLFREIKDENKFKPHNTYVNKPTVIFQKQAETSKFDEFRNNNEYRPGENLHIPTPDVIPVAIDAVYNPSHPDADWSGLVHTTNRKHSQNHSSQMIHLEQTDAGIIGNSNERLKTRNIHPGKSHDFLIGGISAGNDQWKTNYSRFAGNDKSATLDLTSDNQRKLANEVKSNVNSSLNNSRNQPQYEDRKIYGSHARSFINNISLSIADKIESDTSPMIRNNKPDPSLITQNYVPMPGYTGRRPIR